VHSSFLTPLPPSEEPASAAPSPRRWQVGTLAYGAAGLAVLFCWLLGGDFALSMRDRAVPPVMQLLFKKFGASDTLVGLLFSSLPGTIGLIVGPVAGYRSDRLRTSWGRRLPFLLATTPAIVLAIVGMAFCSLLGNLLDRLLGPHSPGLPACSLFVLGAFWVLYELSCMVANLIFQGLVNDVVPQKIMGRFMALLRVFSLAAGIIFNYWIMSSAETHSTEIFLGVAAIYGLGFTWMCLRVREGEYSPPPPAGAKRGYGAGIASYFRDSFSHGYYRLYFATTVLAVLAPSAFNLFSVFYAKSLGMSMAYYGKCVALTFAMSLCLAYPLGVLADRLHPLRLGIAFLTLYALAMAWGALFVRDVSTFAVALVLHGVLSGTYFTAMASLGQRLLPRTTFTEMTSAAGIVGGLAGIAFAPAIGFLLDRTGHAYIHTFHIGLIMTGGAVVSGLFLHRRFMAYGGPKNYQAP